MARGVVKKKPGDFKRPKRKVGRKVLKSLNATNTSFKSRRINLLEQSVLQEKGNVVTHRHLNLQDVLVKSGHYNAYNRKDALLGLKELVANFPQDVVSSIGVVVKALLSRMVDAEQVVRDECIIAWTKLLEISDENALKPFVSVITAYLCSGMTHLQSAIRYDVLKCIDAMVQKFPSLLLFQEEQQIGRLLSNFQDILSSKSAQNVSHTNSYKTKGAQSNKSFNLRCQALKTLTKLLQTLQTITIGSDLEKNTRSVTVPECKTLLLYPALMKEVVDAQTLVSTKTIVLIEPLVELWLECSSSDIELLDPKTMESMKQIVSCLSIIVLSAREAIPDSVLNRLRTQLLSVFPLESNRVQQSQYNERNDWVEINLCLCEFACLLKSELHVMEYLETVLEAYLDDEEYRRTPSTAKTIKSVLSVATRAIQQISLVECKDLLDTFSQYYQKCSTISVSKRHCIDFIVRVIQDKLISREEVEKLNVEGDNASWKVVAVWIQALLDYLLLIDTQKIDLMEKLIKTIILVIERIPSKLIQIEASVEAFEPNRLSTLPETLQRQLVCLLYHFSSYSKSFLQTLKKSCRDSRLSVSVRISMLEIIYQRRSVIPVSHLVSFFISVLLTSPEEFEISKEIAVHQHVCICLERLEIQSTLVQPLLEPIKASISNECLTVAVLYCFHLFCRQNDSLPQDSAYVADLLSHYQADTVPVQLVIEYLSKSVGLLQPVVSELAKRKHIDGLSVLLQSPVLRNVFRNNLELDAVKEMVSGIDQVQTDVALLYGI